MTSLRFGQEQPRLLARDGLDHALEAVIAAARLHQAAPAFDHAFERLQRLTGDDRGGNHHAARQLAMQGEIAAPAQHGDLRCQPGELGETAHPVVAVEGVGLGAQRARLLATPLRHAFVQHAHGVDHLGVARERLGLCVRLLRE